MAQVGGLPPAKPPFTIRSYGGKCLDFGPPPQVIGAPVFINACNGTAAQRVLIDEVNVYHEVILRAGTLVIGVRSQVVSTPGPGGPTQSATESPLELQLPESFFPQGGGQRFALDGDSIMLASNRNRVVKVQNGRGTNRTPLVLGRRALADAEFWTFTATNGSSLRPTRGFVRVSQVDRRWTLERRPGQGGLRERRPQCRMGHRHRVGSERGDQPYGRGTALHSRRRDHTRRSPRLSAGPAAQGAP